MAAIEDQFEGCTSCSTAVRDGPVNFPPGRPYPVSLLPLTPLEILFVGVAPPRRGDHFYTTLSDKLRIGLFGVLTKLGSPCKDIEEFVTRRFFLIHTAKCAIKGTADPCLRVSTHCSSLSLLAEIEALQPRGICWLSKNVACVVAASLASTSSAYCSPVSQVGFGHHQAYSVSTAWPGRGWEKETERDLQALFKVLDATRAV